MASEKLPGFLLVDGYNIIGFWQDLKLIKHHHGLDAARRELVEHMINYTALRGYRTQVVFDAHYQDTPVREEPYNNFLSVLYTGYKQSADSYIEKFCANFQRQHIYTYERLIVATSDRAQQLTALGYGAHWLSAPNLVKEVCSTIKTMKPKQQCKKSQASRGMLFHGLDHKTQQKLQQLRRGK
ncbi:MAG: NYN domain-containing protein [Synechococcaceae cyanobacterium RL_1_2]|nr:NYN domain-containing protein [Synechococcaceae cyanobacterium RL_1_2]